MYKEADYIEYKEYLRKRATQHCQCEHPNDAGGLSCPGPENCPFSDVEEGEELNEKS